MERFGSSQKSSSSISFRKAIGWREPFARGCLAIAVSLVFLIFPHTTATIIAFGFGVYAVFDGLFGLALGSRNPPPAGGRWTTMMVAGGCEIVIGVTALTLASATAATIGTFIGASGIIAGVLGIAAGFRGPGAPRETPPMIAGAFTALVGLVLLFVPLAVIVAQIWTVAAYGIVLGSWFVLWGLNLRRASR